ncbi:hypothetical protein GCM10010305_59310 [Streptomyces termitum]|uniref:Uncharacterized protein n=1 Tax=Streptomyces termitum TaxID=67368 RepID=A0A918T853_9ACTN|nr:hypothetical protein GCM10010305_59310 [Streptomyces termitum]
MPFCPPVTGVPGVGIGSDSTSNIVRGGLSLGCGGEGRGAGPAAGEAARGRHAVPDLGALPRPASAVGCYLTAVSSGSISSIAYGIDRTVLKENAAPMSGPW